VRVFAATALTGLVSAAAASQSPAHLEFEGDRWRVEAEHAQIVEYLGAEALHWRDGLIWLDGRQLDTGEIRFEIALNGRPGHSGVIWRSQGAGDWEKFYFRHHLSGLPDAVQYTPVFGDVTGWQIYSDADAMSAVDHGLNRWIPVRVVIAADQADIFVDGELAHHIPDLARERAAGGVGFWQLSPNDQASAYVRNVEILPAAAPQIVGRAAERANLPDGLVREWRVSAPFDAEDVAGLSIEAIRSGVPAWSNLEVEPNGIANLARAARFSEGDTVLAEVTVTAQTAQTAMAQFGYSDIAHLALNGEGLFTGDNGWSSRDYRYLGTVTRHIGVPLRLERQHAQLHGHRALRRLGGDRGHRGGAGRAGERGLSGEPKPPRQGSGGAVS